MVPQIIITDVSDMLLLLNIQFLKTIHIKTDPQYIIARL